MERFGAYESEENFEAWIGFDLTVLYSVPYSTGG